MAESCKHGIDRRFCAVCNGLAIAVRRTGLPRAPRTRRSEAADRAALLSALEREPTGGFRASELKTLTGVPKSLVDRLLREVDAVQARIVGGNKRYRWIGKAGRDRD